MEGSPATALTAGERLDRLPVTPLHWKIFALLVAGLFIDSVEIFLGGGVAAALLKEGWSTMELNASFQFFTFLGLTIGALLAGVVSDRFGRRFSFQFNLLVFGIASIASAFAPDMKWLIGLRFIMGLGLGAEVVVTYATLTEFMPARVRGRFISFFVIFSALTLFSASLLSLAIIPTFGWRPCFFVVGVTALLLWFVRKALPESPRWLETKARFDEAEEILRKLEGEHYRAVPTLQHAVRIKAVEAPFADLFKPGMISRTLTTAAIITAVNLSLYSFSNWLPTFLVQQGRGITFSLAISTLMTAGAPIGAVIAFLLSDRFNRKPLIITGLLLAAAMGAIYPTVSTIEAATLCGFLLNGCLYFLVATGHTGFAAEVFPTEIRHRGVGFGSMCGRLAAMLCPYAVVPLYAWGGVGAVVGMCAVALVSVPLFVWLYCPEPNKLSLEEAGATADAQSARPRNAVPAQL